MKKAVCLIIIENLNFMVWFDFLPYSELECMHKNEYFWIKILSFLFFDDQIMFVWQSKHRYDFCENNFEQLFFYFNFKKTLIKEMIVLKLWQLWFNFFWSLDCCKGCEIKSFFSFCFWNLLASKKVSQTKFFFSKILWK